jgi:hypothetical protein
MQSRPATSTRPIVPGTRIRQADFDAARKSVVDFWLHCMVDEWGRHYPTQRGIRVLEQLADNPLRQIMAEPFEAWEWFVDSSAMTLEEELEDAFEPEWFGLVFDRAWS